MMSLSYQCAVNMFSLLMMTTNFAWVSSICPLQCHCDDNLLKATCSNSNLDMVPITLNPRLKKMFLNSNQIGIQEVSSSLHFYPALEVLSLSSNRLTSLGNKGFPILRHLKLLKLDDNQIQSLSNKSFLGLKSLRYLNMAQNSIVALNPNSFLPLNNLETLDLSRNPIKSISRGAFHGLSKLKSLSLRDNGLHSINSLSLSLDGVPSLILLDLRGNRFGAPVTFYPFQGLDQLEFLRLDYCELTGVLKGSGQGILPSLKSLTLRGNKIEVVAMSDNQFWEALNCLDLRENPLNCNCSLVRFQHFLLNATQQEGEEVRKTNRRRRKRREETELRQVNQCEADMFNDMRQVLCANPVQVKGRLLVDINFEEEICNRDNYRGNYLWFLWSVLLLTTGFMSLFLVYSKASLLRTKNYPQLVSPNSYEWLEESASARRFDLRYPHMLSVCVQSNRSPLVVVKANQPYSKSKSGPNCDL